MQVGKIYKNSQGRYQVEDSTYYFTCGDPMQVYDYDTGEWLDGRIEHGDIDYYWTNDKDSQPLYNGMMVRYE